MVKIVRFFSYLLFFVVALMAFVPKSSVYYLFEKNLQKFDIVISKESLEESLTTLTIDHLNISAKKIDSAVIAQADVTLLLVYNSIVFKDVQLSSLVDSYIPSKIEHLKMSYSLLNPLEITADAEGEFGNADVKFNVVDRNLTVKLHPSKKMLRSYKKTMRMLKKNEQGDYVYAKTF